ncbi:trigger factor [Deltaproteobacteria bacterium]|nr:trigger factor [Deltaproteobacteria bacterium]
MAELADAPDLGSGGETLGGSTPPSRTPNRVLHMSFAIEQVSSVQKRLRFTVPGAEVSQKLDAAFKNLATKVKIPGFRPGKVPRKMLEDRYGKQLRSEVAGELMNLKFQGASTEIDFLGQPTVEETGVIGQGDFTFSITVQVKPDVELNTYLGLKIRYPLAAITDDQVEADILRRLQGQARLVDVEESRAVESGDLVLTEISDGDTVLEAGTMVNTAAERYYPGIEALVLGLKQGESRTGEVTIADSSAVAANRGKQFTATVKVLGIQVQKVPDLDDTVAGQAGYEGGADAMRAAVRFELETSANEAARNQARIHLLQELVKTHEVSVPAALTEKNLKLLLEELGVQAAYRGRDPRSIRYSEAQLADLRVRAEFAAKAGLILESISRKEGIAITADDLERKYQEIADMRGQRVEAIRGYIQKDGAVADLKKHLLEERALDWVLERCELEYVSENDGPAAIEAAPAAAAEPAAEAVAEKPKKKASKKAEAAEAAPAEAAPADAAPEAEVVAEKPKKKPAKKKAEE